MFPLEQGAFEMLLIGALALIIVGPKDLPVLMRRVGQFTAKMRSMAAEFRASFDELARQSELDELRREVEALRSAPFTPSPTPMMGPAFEPVALEHQSNELSPPPPPPLGPEAPPEGAPQDLPAALATAPAEAGSVDGATAAPASKPRRKASAAAAEAVTSAPPSKPKRKRAKGKATPSPDPETAT